MKRWIVVTRISLFKEENGELDAMEDDTIKQDKALCGTCVSREPDYVLFPCGHVYFCMECFDKW